MSNIKFWDGSNWIDPCEKEVRVYTGDITGWKLLKDGDAFYDGEYWRKIICNLDVELNEEFEYLVIRYKWNFENGGRDLDTRTAIIGLDLVKNEVGYVRDNPIPVKSPVRNLSNAYLFWGGDNQSTQGPESICVNLSNIKAENPSLTTIQIRTRAFWYVERKTGDVEVEFETYLGGTMEAYTISEFVQDFRNKVNGEIVSPLQKVIANRNILTQQSANIAGDDIGILTYYFATRTATFTLA